MNHLNHPDGGEEEACEKLKDFEKYEISSFGAVRNIEEKPPKLLIPTVTPYGFLSVALYHNNGDRWVIGVEYLVAKCFIPKPPIKDNVIHRDLNKKNNKVQNLEWVNQVKFKNFKNLEWVNQDDFIMIKKAQAGIAKEMNVCTKKKYKKRCSILKYLIMEEYKNVLFVFDIDDEKILNISSCSRGNKWTISFIPENTWKDVKRNIDKKLVEDYKQNSCSICCEEIMKNISCSKCSQSWCGKCHLKLFETYQGICVCPYCRFAVGQKIPQFMIEPCLNEMKFKMELNGTTTAPRFLWEVLVRESNEEVASSPFVKHNGTKRNYRYS
jgi:hypothetical protein